MMGQARSTTATLRYRRGHSVARQPEHRAEQASCSFGRALIQQPALQQIYDTAPIGLAFLSPDCRYVYINQHLTEICGISVADHIGRRVRDTVPALPDGV